MKPSLGRAILEQSAPKIKGSLEHGFFTKKGPSFEGPRSVYWLYKCLNYLV